MASRVRVLVDAYTDLNDAAGAALALAIGESGDYAVFSDDDYSKALVEVKFV